MPQPKSIWLNAGEISGDVHGASLLKALRERDPALRLMGMGGPEMRAAGLESFFRVEDLSVMGFVEVFSHLPKIVKMLRNMEKRMAREKPDALVVIDAPDFHFRLIKAARRLGIPVYYYISPKVWVWRQGRAEFIKENVRRLISILPFEADFYRGFGLEVDYVGNPLLDQIDLPALDLLAPVPGRIGLLPGSRKSEVSALLPRFAEAARIMRGQMPGLEFCCARAPGMSEEYLRSFWPEDLPLAFFPPEERHRAMRQCQMLIAASGTVVLESALIGTPTILTYRMSSLTFNLAKVFIKIPYVGLPNFIAGRKIIPELLQEEGEAPKLAALALDWLRQGPDGPDMRAMRRDFAELREKMGGPGATGRAAGIILEDMQKPRA